MPNNFCDASMAAGAGAGVMPGTMAFIPRWLLECKELTIAEKLLLAAVMTLPYGLFQHVSDFVMDMGMSKSHGCRTMRQLRAKAWLYEDCSMRGRSVIRVNMAKAEKMKIEWQAREAAEREIQISLLTQMKLQAGAQSPAESVAQNAANSSTSDEGFSEIAEIPAQIAVGQTFIPAVGSLLENCGKNVGNFGTVPSAALEMAQSVPPAALAVPSAAQAVPPAAPIYIQYKYNKNSNIYSNGRSPIARGRAQAAQQWEINKRTSNTEGLNLEPMCAEASADSAAAAQASACADEVSAHTPSFTILEEIDLTFPRKHSSPAAEQRQETAVQPQAPLQQLPQVQPLSQPQACPQTQVLTQADVQSLHAVPHFSPMSASQPARAVSAASPRQAGRASSSIGFQDVLDAVTSIDVTHGFTQVLHTSAAAMAGEIVAHYTADGRNWCVGRSRTTKQTLPALCQRYIERALEQAADKPQPARARGTQRTRAASTIAASTKNAAPRDAFIHAYGRNSVNDGEGSEQWFKPAAGYVDRPANFNPPPPPGTLTEGEKIFGRNADVMAALAMRGAQ